MHAVELLSSSSSLFKTDEMYQMKWRAAAVHKSFVLSLVIIYFYYSLDVGSVATVQFHSVVFVV